MKTKEEIIEHLMIENFIIRVMIPICIISFLGVITFLVIGNIIGAVASFVIFSTTALINHLYYR